MNEKNSLKTLIEAKNGNQSIPAIQLVRNNPIIASTISKLHQDHTNQTNKYDQVGNKKLSYPNHSNIIEISRDVAQKRKDNENVLELFPELKLAGDILISSIIAPKDMTTTELNINLPSNLKVSPISNVIQPIIEEYLVNEYKIYKEVPELIKKVLMVSGSYPIVVIPENSVDDLINGKVDISFESLKPFMSKDGLFHSLGILGPSTVNTNHKTQYSMESIFNEDLYKKHTTIDPLVKIEYKKSIESMDVYVTDNISVLKLPRILKTKRDNQIRSILSRTNRHNVLKYGMEDRDTLTDRQLTSLIYKNKNTTNNYIRKVKTNNEISRETIGAPLIMKLPSESVIPVYQPGNSSHHIGYFIALDSEGNPLSYNSEYTAFKDMQFKQAMTTNMNSSLIQKTANQFNTPCENVTFDNITKVYTEIIEADLLSRLRNGITGNNVSIAKPEEIFRIMTARKLSKERTQLLFVPIELLTYFAIDFRENGTGKSLLDDMMVLNSLRAVTMFANINRNIINSIGRTEVEINIDEKDPQPRKTLEIAMHEVLATKQNNSLPATFSPVDIMSYIQTAAIQFKLGEIPGLPSTNINFSEVSTSYEKPDTDLEEKLKERQIMGIGVPVEMVDNASGVDFATTATNNNILLSKRVIQYQEKFEPLITENARKCIINHGTILHRIKEAISNNLSKLTDIVNADPIFSEYQNNKEALVHLLALEAVSNFEITFSKPDITKIENLNDAFDIYLSAIEKGIEAYFSTDILSSAFVGELASERVDEIKNMIKAQLLRKWMIDNNMLNELADMVTIDEDGNYEFNIVETQRQHTNTVIKLIRDLMKKTTPVAKASDADLTKITGEEPEGNMYDTDVGDGMTSDSSSDDSSDEDTSEDSNDDDLDEGLDMPDLGDF